MVEYEISNARLTNETFDAKDSTGIRGRSFRN